MVVGRSHHRTGRTAGRKVGTTTLSIRVDDELRDKYNNLARATARSRNELVNEALQQYATEKLHKIALVQEGLAQLRAGQGIAHDEVTVRIAATLARRGSGATTAGPRQAQPAP
jgi:predicted transcriptional regulator